VVLGEAKGWALVTAPKRRRRPVENSEPNSQPESIAKEKTEDSAERHDHTLDAFDKRVPNINFSLSGNGFSART